MNRNILITGGAQGIGRAISELLLAEPETTLIVIDKQQTQFINDCVAGYGDRFFFHLQDIADEQGLAKVLAVVKKQPIDGIVNNAGEVYFESWESLSMDTWGRTLAVNVSAPLSIVHTLRDSLTQGSAVVNMASIDGVRAGFETVAYAASKAALISLTQSLAAILGEKGVRVNAVAPGWVETEMTKDTLPKEASWITPLGRSAQATDVAKLVRFLLSPDASFISGETITIDGGLTVVDYTLKIESEKQRQKQSK